MSDEESEQRNVPAAGLGLQVNMMLCDAAQVNNGKLYILGGGLAVIGPQPQPLAVAIQVMVPWDRANIAHSWRLELIDEDGRPVGNDDRPLAATGNFEAGRPAGLRPGSPLPMALAISIAALNLPPSRAFDFRFSIDDQSESSWKAGLVTRPAAK